MNNARAIANSEHALLLHSPLDSGRAASLPKGAAKMKLTRDEIYVVVFLLSALVIGSVVKYYRHREPIHAVAPAVQESGEDSR